MPTIKTSVIIPTKNPGAIFREVLPAIINQETPWPYEIIVIDSGSQDGTVEYVRSFEPIRLIQIRPEEFGHGRTRNQAIGQARGEFCALVTHDAKPADKHWLNNLVSAAESAPDVAGAFGRHIAYPESGPYVANSIREIFALCAQRGPRVRIENVELYMRDQNLRKSLHFFSNNNACLRRQVWEKIPFPDISFAEDQAWAKSTLEAGYAIAYANDAAVYHSHVFSVGETLMRGFDEARALHAQFGYRFCSKFSRVSRYALRETRREIKYSRDNRQLFSHWRWILKSPLTNFCRFLGLYLGERSASMPPWLVGLLSRDLQMKVSGQSTQSAQPTDP